MKRLEHNNRTHLAAKTPAIVRLDGKSFHTLTRGMEKPFSSHFMRCMRYAARKVCEEIDGCKLAYIQSDEVSLVLSDRDNDATQGWFDFNVQKLCSVSASVMTYWFSIFMEKKAFFDARCFSLPPLEVENYLHWRQLDCERNAIRMVGHGFYSAKQLNNVKNSQLLEMLRTEKNIDFAASYPLEFREGSVIMKEESGWEINAAMKFKNNRELIRELINHKEDLINE